MKHAAIIGGGLGGMSAALALVSRGWKVTLFEKNPHLGGKLNVMRTRGFSFDLGPSILTLPQVFEELFSMTGKRFRDYVPIQELDLHWRNFFEDGSVIDLLGDIERQASHFADIEPRAAAEFRNFLAYSRGQFDLVNQAYLAPGSETFWQIVRRLLPAKFRRLDGLGTMNETIRRKIHDPRLRTIFSFFVKYIGSSADRAPGFINLMPWVQYGFGLWYVQGGMYNLARGYERALLEAGVDIRLGCEIAAIDMHKGKATGVRCADGCSETVDAIVSNMEVIPAHSRLLRADSATMRRFRKFEPACSGLVIHLGLDTTYPQLAHHNFLYSADQHDHFASVFERYELPADPTIYLVAPSRTDPSVVPEGCDNLKLLPHIPHIRDERPFTQEDYERLKERVLDKCERMGLAGLREHTIVEHMWTPLDIQQNYYSTRGSIYGVVSDITKNYALKAPRQSPICPNLFFAGGSVNPGGGMPMTALSGMHAAAAVDRFAAKA